MIGEKLWFESCLYNKGNIFSFVILHINKLFRLHYSFKINQQLL